MKLFYPVFLTGLFSGACFADAIESIEITGRALDKSDAQLHEALSQRAVDFAAGGGLSPLPVLNGMMGERIQILADGAPITAACGNQMNPPLSYVATSRINHITVNAAVSPVSAGGDNIAGVIQVDTLTPIFGTEVTQVSGEAGLRYKTVNQQQTYYLNSDIANDTWFLGYSGQYEKAESYDNGNGDKVLDTLYKAHSHAITTGYQDNHQDATVKVAYQSIPYQGFAGQYMDMTDNRSYSINARYRRHHGNSHLEAIASLRDVSHKMGFFTSEKTGMMPMNTASQDITLKLAWETPVTELFTLALGSEYHANQLDDWWPAVEGSMMMGPSDYININDGQRERTAIYAEIDGQPFDKWSFTAGSRIEYVATDTGPVQPYNPQSIAMSAPVHEHNGNHGMMANPNGQAAAMFNMADRSQEDLLVDIAAQAAYQIDGEQQLTFGIARKNRAPNLYERYTWGRSVMATTMIGWFADGNGYIGDINLEPETAYTASAVYQYETPRTAYSADLWYTHIDDYIDVDKVGEFNQAQLIQTQRNILQFTNLDARLYGVTLNAGWLIADNQYGRWQLTDTFRWQKGERKASDEPLYQILPVQNTLQLTHRNGQWQNRLQWEWIGNKFDTDPRRLENATESYSLVSVSTRYSLQNWQFEMGIENLFNKQYQLPLGGVSVAAFKNDVQNGYSQLDGPGRSFNIGIEYQF